MMTGRTWFIGILMGASAALVAAADPPYHETQARESWWSAFWIRPATTSAALQLAHARHLRDTSRPRAAARAYRALASTWPASPEAPIALYERARLLEERGQLEDAFEQYQQLLQRYGTRCDVTDVLARQRAIADRVAQRRSMRWLFGGFATPERALPLYQQLWSNAPNSEAAASVALTIGRIQEENREWDDAIAAYARVVTLYPARPEAEEASARRVLCLWRIVQKYPNHTGALDEVSSSAAAFLTRYPESRWASEIRTIRDQADRRRAEIAYESARFYERRRDPPSVVRTAYERFLEQFPNSPWSDAARQRLRELDASPGAKQ